MYTKAQSVTDVVIEVPVITDAGANASGLTLGDFTIAITDPDLAAVAAFTAPTITEPYGDGIYRFVFASAAADPAFTDADTALPYRVRIGHSDASVSPFIVDTFVTSLYPWERGVPNTGEGANDVTLTVEAPAGTPVGGVSVVIRNSSDTTTLATCSTDLEGECLLRLDGGSYVVKLFRSGYNFTVPEALTVSGTTTETYTGSVVSPSAPVAGLQNITVSTFSLGLSAAQGAIVYARNLSIPQIVDGAVVSSQIVDTEVDSSGNAVLSLIKGAEVDIRIEYDGVVYYRKAITVSSDDTKDISGY
jgi:hypothetical protein